MTRGERGLSQWALSMLIPKPTYQLRLTGTESLRSTLTESLQLKTKLKINSDLLNTMYM